MKNKKCTVVQKSAILAFGDSWEAVNARKWWKHVWMQNHLFQETMPPFRHVCIGGVWGGGAVKNIEYILVIVFSFVINLRLFGIQIFYIIIFLSHFKRKIVKYLPLYLCNLRPNLSRGSKMVGST